MRYAHLLPILLFTLFVLTVFADEASESGLQFAENPPMQWVAKPAPPLPEITQEFEVREGFELISSLEQFREAIRKDNQKIRLKPGRYRAESIDPALDFQEVHAIPGEKLRRTSRQAHIFCVSGSNNVFDLRGTVIETPVSVQSRLEGGAHVADCWHINGSNNTFEGGYFRNVLDRPYPHFRPTECEFEICNDGNTFLDCLFDIQGSIPFGYSDYYGKGGPNFGRLAKHSFMGINSANQTSLIGCKVFMKSFGHCVHLHNVDGLLIQNCEFHGCLRPTDDIYREKVGRAVEYDFQAMYRGTRPIPHQEMISLCEDGIRAYNDVRNVRVEKTIIERFRGCVQLLCTGDVSLKEVTVRQAGDFSFDISTTHGHKIEMRDCHSDAMYRPVMNLSRGKPPLKAVFELEVLPSVGVKHAKGNGQVGKLCGLESQFTITSSATTEELSTLPAMECGGRQPMKDCQLRNTTVVPIVLHKNVSNCTIHSVGKVIDHGRNNQIHLIEPPAKSLP